jgi:hypothetical protein
MSLSDDDQSSSESIMIGPRIPTLTIPENIEFTPRRWSRTGAIGIPDNYQFIIFMRSIERSLENERRNIHNSISEVQSTGYNFTTGPTNNGYDESIVWIRPNYIDISNENIQLNEKLILQKRREEMNLHDKPLEHPNWKLMIRNLLNNVPCMCCMEKITNDNIHINNTLTCSHLICKGCYLKLSYRICPSCRVSYN